MKRILFLSVFGLLLSCDMKNDSRRILPKNSTSQKAIVKGVWRSSDDTEKLSFYNNDTFTWASKNKTAKGRYFIKGAIISFIKKNGKGRCEQFLIRGDTLLLRPTHYKSKVGVRIFKR